VSKHSNGTPGKKPVAFGQGTERSEASASRAAALAKACQASETTRRLSAEQRRVLKLLAGEPRGVTGHLLVIAHGFEMEMLAGLAHEGLVAAAVGDQLKVGGNAIEVVRFWITAAGRRALERRPTTAG
jgi:hypothetical protein